MALFVDNSDLARDLSLHYPHLSIYHVPTFYPRDSSLWHPKELQLLQVKPFEFKSAELFNALGSTHQRLLGGDLTGKGLSNATHATLEIWYRKFRPRFRPLRLPIEGGNCHLFLNARGETHALVGRHSVILCMIALKRQRYFTHARIQSYAEDSVRPKFVKWAKETGSNPKRLQTAYRITKGMIAEALNAPVTVLYQQEYHLDMFAHPIGQGDDILLNSASETLAFLHTADLGIPEPLKKEYLKHVSALQLRDILFVRKNQHRLTKRGFRVIKVPAVFPHPTLGLNLINGITIHLPEGPEFAIRKTAPMFATLITEFWKQVKADLPTATLREVGPPDHSDVVALKAGLHCNVAGI